jgi:hypothetical protein
METYEFQVMSSFMSCIADNPKVAVATSIWWSRNAPAVCEDKSMSPMHLFGFYDEDSIPRMNEYFDSDFETFYTKNEDQITNCINSIMPFDKRVRGALDSMLKSAELTEEQTEKVIKAFIEANGTY